MIENKEEKIKKLRNYLNFANPYTQGTKKSSASQVFTSEEVDGLEGKWKEKDDHYRRELANQIEI